MINSKINYPIRKTKVEYCLCGMVADFYRLGIPICANCDRIIIEDDKLCKAIVMEAFNLAKNLEVRKVSESDESKVN